MAVIPISEQFAYVEPPHFLKCVICTDVMKNPVSLTCGHSFCSSCCQLTLQQKKECPVCRKDVLSPAHPNIALCQALDEQQVYCPFGPKRKDFSGGPVFEADPQGCTKVLKRCDVPSHEKECPYRWIQCNQHDTQSDERCRVLCRKIELTQHQKECEFRLVPCANEGCADQISLRSMDKHKSQCLCEEVQCPNEGCAEMQLRKYMTTHAAQCAYRVVQCIFSKYGCQEKGTVAMMNDHMEKAVNDHLLLLCSALDHCYHKQMHERRVNCPKRKFKCIIHHFDRLAKKQVIDVDLDPSWKLKIWPNGEDKRHKGYVSIRLFSREACATFKVEGPYTLRIANQMDPNKSIVKMTEASSREWADSVRGWGFPAFAKVEDVLDPEVGFVKDNRLVVEVEVMVQSVVEVVEYDEDEEGTATTHTVKC